MAGCEQCGLKRNQGKVRLQSRAVWLKTTVLGPRLAGSCTPPFKRRKSVANDAFSTCFDDGFGWGSVSGILGKEGGPPAKGLGAKRVA